MEEQYSFGVYDITKDKCSVIYVKAESEDQARAIFNSKMGFESAPTTSSSFLEFYWKNKLAVSTPQIIPV